MKQLRSSTYAIFGGNALAIATPTFNVEVRTGLAIPRRERLLTILDVDRRI
jgi:hypothetical protein